MSVTWTGLDGLKHDLDTLAPTLAAETTPIVEAAAAEAAAEIIAAYPAVTGDTRRGVSVTHATTGTKARSVVRNRAPLAYIIEHGTEVRHYVTRNGVRHLTGRMPPLHIFGRIVPRHRRAMYAAIGRVLEAHGATVTVDAG